MSIDYNPELVRSGDRMGHPVIYGDAEDPEFVASLPLATTQWVVSTARECQVNKVLIHALRSLNYIGRIAVTAHNQAEVAMLEQAGADLVMVPFVDAAKEAASQLLAPGTASDHQKTTDEGH